MKKIFVPSTALLMMFTYSKAQNIGIGTTAPGQKLDIIGNVRAGSPTSNAIMGTHSTYGNLYAAWWKEGSDYTLLTDGANSYFNAPSASGVLLFRSGNNDKLYIRGTDGFAGLGTNTPEAHLDVSGSGFQKMRVTSINNGGAAVELANTGGTSWRMWGGSYVSIEYGADLSAVTSTTVDINSISRVLEPYSDNSFGLGTAAYRWSRLYVATGVVESSDARLKKNIRNFDYGISTLMQMRPVSFQWKDKTEGDRNHLGFLAQDMIKLVPEVVYHESGKADPAKKKCKGQFGRCIWHELFRAYSCIGSIHTTAAEND